MKLAIALTLLCLAGCTTQTQSHGNEPTYSGNSNGNFAGKMVEACADLALDEFRKDPSIDADGLFKYCVNKQGVRSI